jgi:large subunit ribosomal protein L7/L12
MSDAAITLSKEEQAVIDALTKLNVIQLNNVVKYMEKTYGISAAAPVAMAAAPAAGGAAAGADDEKSSFDVELADSGAQKIAIIKVVREITQLGLGEAKDLVDKTPAMLKKGVAKADAQEMKKKIEAAGGKVNLK